MSKDAFDCHTCGHPAHKHAVQKKWPSWTKGCEACDCSVYTPNYKHKGDK